MKKNTLYTILLTFVLGWGATSCNDFLDSEPLSKISPEQYFTELRIYKLMPINSTLTYYLHMVKEWGYLAMRVQTIK